MTISGAMRQRSVALLGAVILLYVAAAAPAESEEEAVAAAEAGAARLGGGAEAGGGDAPWEALDVAALRQLLLQVDADERAAYAPRALRSWSPLGARGWGGAAGGPRALDSRAARQWRTDKRQVRFRQCYFNPISCFRK